MAISTIHWNVKRFTTHVLDSLTMVFDALHKYKHMILQCSERLGLCSSFLVHARPGWTMIYAIWINVIEFVEFWSCRCPTATCARTHENRKGHNRSPSHSSHNSLSSRNSLSSLSRRWWSWPVSTFTSQNLGNEIEDSTASLRIAWMICIEYAGRIGRSLSHPLPTASPEATWKKVMDLGQSFVVLEVFHAKYILYCYEHPDETPFTPKCWIQIWDSISYRESKQHHSLPGFAPFLIFWSIFAVCDSVCSSWTGEQEQQERVEKRMKEEKEKKEKKEREGGKRGVTRSLWVILDAKTIPKPNQCNGFYRQHASAVELHWAGTIPDRIFFCISEH